MSKQTRRQVLGLAATGCAGVLAGCGALGQSSSPSIDDSGDGASDENGAVNTVTTTDDGPPLHYAKGTGSFDEDPPKETGWVYVADQGERATLKFDIRLCTQKDVVIDLSNPIGNNYVLDFTPEGGATNSTPEQSSCGGGTYIEGGGVAVTRLGTAGCHGQRTGYQAG